MQQAMDESRDIHAVQMQMQYEGDIQDAMEQSRLAQFKKHANIRESISVQPPDEEEYNRESDKNEAMEMPVSSLAQEIQTGLARQKQQASLSQFEDDRMDSVTV